MSKCPHCHQPYTGPKSNHLAVCHAVGYAFDDKVDFCDLDNGYKGRAAVANTKSAKKRKKFRGKMQVFGKQSPNFKK